MRAVDASSAAKARNSDLPFETRTTLRRKESRNAATGAAKNRLIRMMMFLKEKKKMCSKIPSTLCAVRLKVLCKALSDSLGDPDHAGDRNVVPGVRTPLETAPGEAT